MRLILIRHTETLANKKKIILGQSDSRLTFKGFLQSFVLRNQLSSENICECFSSDIPRCSKLAKIISDKYNLKLNCTALLRSQNKGFFQLKKRSIRNEYLRKNNISFLDWKPKGGESISHVFHRVSSFWKSISSNYQDKTVLIVGHGCSLSCLLCAVYNQDLSSFEENISKKNGSITILNIVQSSVRTEIFDSIAHFI